jgi:dihydroorotase
MLVLLHMANTFDVIIKNATVIAAKPNTSDLIETQTNVGVQNGRIQEIGACTNTAGAKIIDAKGLHLLPGAIDTQVHFRDPGYPNKETLMSGSRAAVYGGVTSFFDMPNTNPPTLTALDVADKMSRSKGKTWCNYAFYLGGSAANVDRLHELENLPGICGIKIFMGSSTGNLLVGSDSIIKQILKNTTRIVSVHSEDNPRLEERKHIVTDKPGHVELHHVWRDEQVALISTKKIVALARETKRQIHILHVTTAEEVEYLVNCKDVATIEVTPQHLTLSAPECYEKLGTFAQMNPPIREKKHQQALWQAVTSGLTDIMGSDHAPHTLKEKSGQYPDTPSGMPGVQTMLPLMLHHVNEKRLSLARVVQLLSLTPANRFKIKNKGQIQIGFDADLTLVDLKSEKEFTKSWLQSQCGWSPFEWQKNKGWVVATIVNGHIVMRDDQIVDPKPHGEPLEFN